MTQNLAGRYVVTFQNSTRLTYIPPFNDLDAAKAKAEDLASADGTTPRHVWDMVLDIRVAECQPRAGARPFIGKLH